MNMNNILIGSVLSMILIFLFFSPELVAMSERDFQLDNGSFVICEDLSIDEDGEFVGDDESIQTFQLTLFSSTKDKIGYLEFEINQKDTSSEILLLSILKERYKRQGYATYLINLVIKILKKNNINQVVLEVEPTNIPALSLYNKLGFIPVEHQQNNKRITFIKVI